MKHLTTLTTMFLLSLLLRWIRLLPCFTSLLLKRYLWLRSLHYFTFTTIKMKSLTTFSTLFYFTTSNPRDRTTLTTLLLSLSNLMFFSQDFQCFHIICMCDSYFIVRKFSGVLHTLLPIRSMNIQSLDGLIRLHNLIFLRHSSLWYYSNMVEERE